MSETGAAVVTPLPACSTSVCHPNRATDSIASNASPYTQLRMLDKEIQGWEMLQCQKGRSLVWFCTCAIAWTKESLWIGRTLFNLYTNSPVNVQDPKLCFASGRWDAHASLFIPRRKGRGILAISSLTLELLILHPLLFQRIVASPPSGADWRGGGRGGGWGWGCYSWRQECLILQANLCKTKDASQYFIILA